MREFTVEITSFCPHACDFCSTNAGKTGQHLEIEKIIVFLGSVTNNDRINISGGEPLAHPRFYEILQLCYAKTTDVWIYTNAIKQLRYNTAVLPEVTVEANVCIIPGRSIYIPQKANRVHLLQLVSHGRASHMKPAVLHVSGNVHDTAKCITCSHIVLQADGQVVKSPCHKCYKESNNESQA